MLNKFTLSLLCLALGIIVLIGCSGNETESNDAGLIYGGENETESNEVDLIDGGRNVTKEMHEVISDYIIEKYASSAYPTEKQFEVHEIYGTSESDGVISVYMWSFFGGYNKATGMEEQTGHSLPAVIRLSKNNNQYKVIEYIEPQDGSMYVSSLKKMFPNKYIKYAQQDVGNIDDLQKEMDKKVKQWLETQE